MAVELEHLSYSSISTYHMCPRSWYFRYVEKVEVPTSTALVFGSAFHGVIEEMIQQRVNGKSIPLADVWGEAWNKQLERNPLINWDGETPESLYNEGTRILSTPDVTDMIGAISPAQDDEGLMIERKVMLHVPDVPVPVIGYVDIIEADGVPADFKTSSRGWNEGKVASELQPDFYLAALKLSEYGNFIPDDLRFRYYVFVKTKTPRVEMWETSRKWSDFIWLFLFVKETWRAIEAEAFPPNPTTWKCSEKWCEYWSMCRGKV